MLYRQTEPHGGFAILCRWMRGMPRGGFVYTSNVDGHFQRAGYSPQRVYEVHGTLARCSASMTAVRGSSRPMTAR